METSSTKKLKIDLFLKEIQLLSQYNKIDSEQIYLQLCNYGIPENEKNQNVSSIFTTLQEKNKQNNQLDVFVDPWWSYFCQFRNKNGFGSRGTVIPYELNPIKIYVPLKSENLERNTQKIFDFISKNNIRHCSKLATHIRTDNLVIRVFSKEEADKIISFINSDEELKNSMNEPNPFCINDGKVGISMDRNLSYNTILSKYIYKYIKMVNDKKNLATCDGFKLFLEQHLKNLQNKTDISNEMMMGTDRYTENMPQFLQSLEEVTNIMIKGIEGADKKELYEYHKEINDFSYNQSKKQEYKDFDYKQFGKENFDLLKEVFQVMVKKYGYNNTKDNLELYRDTGDLSYITRTNGIREKVESSKTFRSYLNLVSLNGMLCQINSMTKEQEEKSQKEYILEDVCRSTYIACQTPERGYCGKNQVASLLIRMQQNNYDYITRLNNARTIARENLKPEEIKDIIKKSLESNGYIIENENDLYELYATHIEYLCNNMKERSDNNVKK